MHHLRSQEQLNQALRRLESSFIETERQLKTRIAVLDQHSGELEALESERELYECLRKIVSEPQVRLDSVGAVFLSGSNLFRGTDNG